MATAVPIIRNDGYHLLMADEVGTGLTRAIAILNALAVGASHHPDGIGVVEISRLVSKEKSQVSRTLKILAAAGLVDRNPDTLGYRLGWRIFTLAASAADQRLLALTPPVLRRLVATTGESAYLSVREGAALLAVLSEDPPHAIQAVNKIGTNAPLHNTSAGRALLFNHTDEEVRALTRDVDFRSKLANAPRDIDDLLARVHHARQQGYAVIDEEFEVGLVAAAAPVRDPHGRIIAAVNVSGPKFRFAGKLHEAALQVRGAARWLTQEIKRAPEDESARTATPGRRPTRESDR